MPCFVVETKVRKQYGWVVEKLQRKVTLFNVDHDGAMVVGERLQKEEVESG